MNSATLPPTATLVAPRDTLAYCDTQSITLPAPLTPLQAWDRIMARPLPGLGLAFRLRDLLSRPFGVAPINGFSRQRAHDPAAGDRLDFFTVAEISATRLILIARDRHLDVMVCVLATGCDLSITASVITHNAFGRAYMLPVAPAHRVIVRGMLRRLVKGMEPGI